MHSDISLVTIIARGVGQSGLYVFDWSLHRWIDFESNAPPNCAVIFGGESLAQLSNHYYLPAMHEVSQVSGSRFSAPFQMLARSNALFDLEQLDTTVVGNISEQRGEFGRQVIAGQFVDITSAKRVSSNFPPTSARIPQHSVGVSK
jgi:hypothetical protein